MKRIHASDTLFGLLCVLIATLGLSFKAIFIKLVYQLDPQIDAASMLALRFLFALPFFVMLLYYSGHKQNLNPISISNYFALMVLGTVGFYLSAILDFSGLAYIPAGLERLILFLYPTVVVIVIMFIRPTEVTLTTFMALLLSYLGIVLVFVEQAKQMTPNMIKGSLLVCAAAICFALYTVASVKHIQRHGSVRFTSLAMLAATMVSVCHAVFVDGFHTVVRSLDVYMLILPMAIVSTVLPLILMAEGIKRIGASRASIISTSGPVLTLCLAFFLLGERLGLFQVIGAVFIISGVILVSRKKST